MIDDDCELITADVEPPAVSKPKPPKEPKPPAGVRIFRSQHEYEEAIKAEAEKERRKEEKRKREERNAKRHSFVGNVLGTGVVTGFGLFLLAVQFAGIVATWAIVVPLWIIASTVKLGRTVR